MKSSRPREAGISAGSWFLSDDSSALSMLFFQPADDLHFASGNDINYETSLVILFQCYAAHPMDHPDGGAGDHSGDSI